MIKFADRKVPAHYKSVPVYTIIDETPPDHRQFSDEATALLKKMTAERKAMIIEQAELSAFRTGDFGTGSVSYG